MARELLMAQNSFQWEAIEGQTLEIENAIRSNARDLKIEGQTYQNFCTYEGEFFNNSGNYKAVEELTNLKSNTTYTVEVDLKSDKDFTGNNKSNIFRVDQYNINENGGLGNGVQGTITSTYQTFKFTFTTVSDFKRAILILRNDFHDTNVGLDSNTMYAKNIKVIEGDHTNTDLPTSINGIESVAERESKNLLENVKWHDGMINNENGLHLDSDAAMYSDLIDIDINTLYHTNLIDNNGNSYRCRLYKADGSYLGQWITASNLKDMYDRRATLKGLAKIRLLILNKTVTPLPSNPVLLSNLYTEGDVNVKGASPWQRISKYVTGLKPNTKYKVSADIQSVSAGSNNYVPQIQFFAIKNSQVVGHEIGSLIVGTLTQNIITTPKDFDSIELRMQVNDSTVSTTICEANFKNIGIFENNLYPVKIAQSNNETDGIVLPNGVKNSIEMVDGVLNHIQRVGKYTANDTRFITTPELIHRTSVTFKIDAKSEYSWLKPKNYSNTKSHPICSLFNYIPSEKPVDELYVSESDDACFYAGGGDWLRVKLTKATYGKIISLTEFLEMNPIIYYELATPITEPLTTTEIPLPQPLRSLPNGVRDTIEGDKLIQRIGKYKITGNEYYELRYQNDAMFTIQCGGLSIEPTFDDFGNNNVKMICDKAVCKRNIDTTFITDKLTVCSRSSIAKGFVIAIPKSLLTEYTIDKAKEYIKSLGGMTVYYELATPIEHTINVPRVPIAKGSNIITTTNNIKPNLYIKYKRKK